MNARIESAEHAQAVGAGNRRTAAIVTQPTLPVFLATHLGTGREQALAIEQDPHAVSLLNVLQGIAQAAKIIAARIAQGTIVDSQTLQVASASPDSGSCRDAAKEAFIASSECRAQKAGIVLHCEQARHPAVAGPYVLFASSLDSVANIESNVALGTVFSIRQTEARSHDGDCEIVGTKQIAAGYALYGPSTMLVITVGRGTHGFTLCRQRDEFMLTHHAMRIPEQGPVVAINCSNERSWERPVQRYVNECRDGSAGVRQRDFDTRWNDSLAADAHRTLMRGGLCLFPCERRRVPIAATRQPLLYQAQSLAWILKQAGGLASSGRARIFDVDADAHALTPLFVGSQHEVERIERYHWEHDRGEDTPFTSPLFNERSLFRPEARV
ncbi:fructose-1,6-bisphosphatase [Paraburkholderia youngii]|uniref:class 1 fructose-bisphosphatase n=1 Tax=Paraburkholderia youngii TaxID=2782701 RepID=UPI003D260412